MTTTFKELLARNKNGDAKYNSGMTKNALFQLVDHYQNIDGLFAEASTCQLPGTKDEDATIMDSSALAIITMIREQAAATTTPLQMVAAMVLANKVKDMMAVPVESANELLLDVTKRRRLDAMLAVITALQNTQGFSRTTFIKTLNKEPSLPLELIWRLHKADAMPLDSYITCNLSRPAVIGGLAQKILSLCQESTNGIESLRKEIVSDLLGHLVKQGYNELSGDDAAAKGLKKVSCALLDNITKKLFSDLQTRRDVNPVEAVLSAGVLVDDAGLKKYCTRQLIVILSLNPVLKVSQAIQQQQQWCFAKADTGATHTYKQLTSLLSAREAVSLLDSVIEQHEVNWQALLTYTAMVLVTFDEAPALIKEWIDAMLGRAMENCERDCLIASFLLVRQACLEGSHVFPAYQTWFQATFGDGNKTVASNKKSFTFLMKFLTDIVPFESPQFLKAHILKPPHVPAKCRPVLGDYLMLAKTRLMDLKESVEELGIYDEAAGSGAAEKDRVNQMAEQDVERALAVYEKTAKVPTSVMEASIFRKPYFVGKFLGALLTPRPLPDIPDVRMKFIDTLLRAEKIPHSLYSNYERSCQKLASQLLEGVSFEDDDDMDDMLLGPTEQLQHALDTFRGTVLASTGDKNTTSRGLSGLVSLLSEKIHTRLEMEVTAHSSSQPVNKSLNLQSPGLDQQAVQVSDAVLHTLCQTQVGMSERGLLGDAGDWLLKLLAMLCDKHPCVWRALCFRTLDLLTSQARDLERYHVACLASLIAHMATFPDVLPTPNVVDDDHVQGEAFVHYLLLSLPCARGGDMMFKLRFCQLYLECCFTSLQGVCLHYMEDARPSTIPPELIKCFSWLVPRLNRAVRTDSIDAQPVAAVQGKASGELKSIHLYQSQAFRKHAQTTPVYQMTLEEWTRREIEVCPFTDALQGHERVDYYEWAVLSHHLIPISTGEHEARPLQRCLTALCNAVLDFDARSRKSDPSSLARCSSCNSGRRHVHGQGHSRSHIVQLIQRLISMMSVGGPSAGRRGALGCPWVVQLFRERIEHLPTALSESTCGSTSAVSAEVENQFSLLRNLSPSVMFCVDMRRDNGVCDSSAVQQVAAFVTDIWRNLLTGGVVLCESATIYLLLALQNIADKFQEEFLQECPLFTASVLVRSQRLQHMFCLADGITSRITRQVTTATKRLLDGEPAEDVQVSGDGGPGWLLGAALYAALVSGGSAADCSSTLRRWAGRSSAEALECTVSFLTCTMARLAWKLLHGQELCPEAMSAVAELWQAYPDYFQQCSCHQEPSPTQDRSSRIAPDICIKLRPVIIARILVRGSRDAVRSVVQADGGIGRLLQCHQQCCHLYESSCLTGDLPSSLSVPSQIVPVSLLGAFSALLKGVMSFVPGQQLLALDQDSLSASDSDLRSYILKQQRRAMKS